VRWGGQHEQDQGGRAWEGWRLVQTEQASDSHFQYSSCGAESACRQRAAPFFKNAERLGKGEPVAADGNCQVVAAEVQQRPAEGVHGRYRGELRESGHDNLFSNSSSIWRISANSEGETG
jgi:hypothetical protein